MVTHTQNRFYEILSTAVTLIPPYVGRLSVMRIANSKRQLADLVLESAGYKQIITDQIYFF